jgi:hypothetical protein
MPKNALCPESPIPSPKSLIQQKFGRGIFSDFKTSIGARAVKAIAKW